MSLRTVPLRNDCQICRSHHPRVAVARESLLLRTEYLHGWTHALEQSPTPSKVTTTKPHLMKAVHGSHYSKVTSTLPWYGHYVLDFPGVQHPQNPQALAQSRPFSLSSLVYSEPRPSRPIETLIIPPPAPLSGLASLLPPHGSRISASTIDLQYREAIGAISERLGNGTWFLDSK